MKKKTKVLNNKEQIQNQEKSKIFWAEITKSHNQILVKVVQVYYLTK